jgi:uncharacterized membrane protein
LVYISGFFEILAALDCSCPTSAWRRLGTYCLIIAVFPANINLAVNNIELEGIPHSPLLYWVRLPLQAVLIAWAWWYTRKPEEQPGASMFAKQIDSLVSR